MVILYSLPERRAVEACLAACRSHMLAPTPAVCVQVPMIGGTGNHEIEQQYDANSTIFASVRARWHVPPGSGSYFYHSENFGAVHSIFLSPYVDYTPGSPQWNWLWRDLSSVSSLTKSSCCSGPRLLLAC